MSSFFTSAQIVLKTHCFLEKFTQSAKIMTTAGSDSICTPLEVYILAVMNVYLLVSFHFCSSVFFMVSPIKAAMTTVNSIQHIRYLVFSINFKVNDFWCDF